MEILTPLLTEIVPKLIYAEGTLLNVPATYEQIAHEVTPATYREEAIILEPAVYKDQEVIISPAVTEIQSVLVAPAEYDTDGVTILVEATYADREVEIIPAIKTIQPVEITPAVMGTQQVLDSPAVIEMINGDLIAPASHGLFISHEAVYITGFAPDENDENWEAVVGGFMATKIRLVVLQRSPVEVYIKGGDGYRFNGVAVEPNGDINKEMVSADANADPYDIYSRVLVMLLNEDNTPMHDIPIRLNLGKGEGGNFARGLKNFYFSCCRTFFGLTQQPMQWLSTKALTYFVFGFDMALDEHGYLTPGDIRLVTPENIAANFIPPDSPAGQLLSKLYDVTGTFPASFDKEAHSKEKMALLDRYGVLEF